MKLEEYKIKQSEIENKARKRKDKALFQLAVDYANEHNPVKRGDMVTSRDGRTIKVAIMKLYRFGSEPQVEYRGRLYTRGGRPFKSGKEACICQSHMDKHVPIDAPVCTADTPLGRAQ